MTFWKDVDVNLNFAGLRRRTTPRFDDASLCVKQMAASIAEKMFVSTLEDQIVSSDDKLDPNPEVEELWLRPSRCLASPPLVSLWLEQLRRRWLMRTQEGKQEQDKHESPHLHIGF